VGVGVGVAVRVSVGVGMWVGVAVGVLVGVGVCVKTSGIAVGPQAVASSVRTTILDSKGSLFIVSYFYFHCFREIFRLSL
jgi:hypothetical protein